MANNEIKAKIFASAKRHMNPVAFLKDVYYGEDGPGGQPGVIEEKLREAVAKTNTQLDDVALAALGPTLAELIFEQLEDTWDKAMTVTPGA